MKHEFHLKRNTICTVFTLIFLAFALCGCSGEVSSREAMEVIVGQLITSGDSDANPDMVKITNSYTQTINGEIFCHFDFTYQRGKTTYNRGIVLVRRGNQIQTISLFDK